MSEQEFRSIYKQYHKKLCYFLNYYMSFCKYG